MAEIELSEPVKEIISEKDSEIEELKSEVKELESESKKKIEKLKSEHKEEKEDLNEEIESLESKVSDLESKVKGYEEENKTLQEELEAMKKGKSSVPLEEAVYYFILGAEGNINIARCAEVLETEKDKVKEAVDVLVESERLEIE